MHKDSSDIETSLKAFSHHQQSTSPSQSDKRPSSIMEVMSQTLTKSPSPMDTGQDDGDEVGAETFTGKIVYNPDGSAYIIEGSEGSDVESEVGSILKEGAIVDTVNGPQITSTSNICSGNSSSNSSGVVGAVVGPIPQVVQAHHISRVSGSAASLQGILTSVPQVLQENLKVPEVPVMHSYRVYSLRDRNNSTGGRLFSSSDDADDEAGDDNNNGQDETTESSRPSPSKAAAVTVPVKPILMCFICKMSFGFAKSFVSHATTEHHLILNDDESHLLGQKNTSAIIQGVGREKEPLLSFLEPKTKSPQPLLQSLLLSTHSSSTPVQSSTASSSSTTNTISTNNNNPDINSSPNSSSATLHQQFQQQLMAMAAAQAAAVAAFRQGHPSSHSSSSPAFPGLGLHPAFAESTSKDSFSQSRPSSNGSLNLSLPKIPEDGRGPSPLEDRAGSASGEDYSELADLANLEKIAKAAAAAIQQQEGSLDGNLLPSHGSSSSPKSSSPNALSCLALSSSPKGSSVLGPPLTPDGSSNLTNNNNMTMMHSRNSCKTLKCPKCNWHYKYQETLEIHMKEKHPENEMNCIYCLTNQPHPRLARGETYTCGYKPYRCEVCNYSTTTKGNLSIHMQSDKHINNVQELQNGNIPTEHLLAQSQAQALALAKQQQHQQQQQPVASQSQPPTTSSLQTSNHPGSNSSSPGVQSEREKVSPSLTSPSSKPKASWRCDVCNYETNIARNLRIHMTSEKHTHNMMVLQQNAKHIQQLAALQQAGLLAAGEPMLPFHPGLFAALAAGAAANSGQNVGGPQSSDNIHPEAAIADMTYNHALLMMASQQQQQRVYRFRCNQCPLAFKTMEKLELHSQYHAIRAATQCVHCSRSFRSVEALQRHFETSHQDMNDGEVETLRQALATNPLLSSTRRGPGVLDPSTTELLWKESNRLDSDHSSTQCVHCSRSFRSVEALQRHFETSHQDMNLELETLRQAHANNPLLSSIRRASGSVLDPSTELCRKDSMRHESDHDDDEPMDAESSDLGLAEQGESLEDYLNSQAVAEDNYNDPSRKYKCHRCKVAFTRQSYLTSHNKTLLHRKGEKMSYPMEKYLDPNRPFKCDICKESFTQKNILLVHYNSVSHLHKLKQAMKESNNNSISSNNNSSSESTPPSSTSVSSSGGNDENKAYRCNICKVSYTTSATLDIHIRSVLHQTRVSKLHDLAISGQIDLTQPLIERPDSDSSHKSEGGKSSSPSPSMMMPPSSSSSASGTPPKTFDQSMEAQLHHQQVALNLAANQHMQLALQAAAAASGSGNNNSPGGGVFPCTRCGSIFPSQETANQHQQLCSLFNTNLLKNHLESTGSSNPSSSKQQQVSPLSDPSLFDPGNQMPSPSEQLAALRASNKVSYSGPSQESQQLCSLFNSTLLKNPTGIGSSNPSSKQQISPLSDPPLFDSGNRIPTASEQLAALRAANKLSYGVPGSVVPTCRSKPPVYKHLLETWGFEIVMQFNEHHQRRKRGKENDSQEQSSSSKAFDKEEGRKNESEATLSEGGVDLPPRDGEDSLTTSTTPCERNEKSHEETKTLDPSEAAARVKEQTKNKPDLPEINRSKCSQCSKEFSSIWVLKAHKEEVHKDLVPLEAVQSFALQFKKDFDSKITSNNPVNNTTTSSSNMATSHVASTVVSESASVPAESEAVAQNDRRSTPAQLPHEGLATASTTSPPTANQAPSANDMNAASQMAAQLQFSQLLMSMGLAGIALPGMPFAAMGIPPPMLPFMMGAQLDPVMAAALNHQAAQAAMGSSTGASPSPSPAGPQIPDPILAAQQKLLQQQQLSAAQQQKRARTRITDEQLKILRQYFDINNSPTEEQLQEMSEKSGLPLKVIKHWFRNTLFKERQRNKDSPYNFNNPPSTFLNLEEYEKTGEAKVVPIDEVKTTDKSPASLSTAVIVNVKSETPKTTIKEEPSTPQKTDPPVKELRFAETNQVHDYRDDNSSGNTLATTSHGDRQNHSVRDSFEYAKSYSLSPHSESSVSSVSTNDTGSQHAAQQALNPLFQSGLQAFAAATGLANPLVGTPLQMAIDAAHRSQAAAAQTPSSHSNRDHASPGSGSQPGKRANRTRFTDYQIKVLQEFFESNAYPKDDDLEYLSKLLNLSPRVIVVWFQNARQKARKVYENQPPASEDDSNPGRFQRTPGLNYQCKKCMQVFQRYYELIKHQKSSCFKDENPLAAQLKAAQEARQTAASPAAPPSATSVMSNTSASTPSPSPSEKQSAVPSSAGTFKCEKCSLVFPRFDQWREHQIVHFMNPNLFPSYPPTSPFGILQFEGQGPGGSASAANAVALAQAAAAAASVAGGMKRKNADDDDSQESFQSTGHQGSQSSQDPPRDKRLRTTILPEQLDYLYQKYQIESNPSRKMLENIAKEVGLKKRVVQVWFQNTRARERKGQFRAHQQVIHKRCPFCRALFKARSALESHLATRHADQYTKGDINIDALPDGDPNEDEMDGKTSVPNELLQMKQYYENSKSFIEKYIDKMSSAGQMPPSDHGDSAQSGKHEIPLDLSKPMNLSGHFPKMSDSNGYDSRSDNETGSESEDDGNDESGPNSPAPGSTTSSVTSPAAGGNGQFRGGPGSNSGGTNKRFRTQMTTVQLKVMKSIFADYKTPSMAECESLGREVGLPKRVVQVWFQNARAKEKKQRLTYAKTYGHEMPDNSSKAAEECNVCGVKYNLKFSSTSMQDHLFSKKHIENLKNHIDSVKKGIENPDDSVDFPAASAIINPSIGMNPEVSESNTNLMQHLQMMGLAGALGVPGLTVNGDGKKGNDLLSKVTNPVLESLKSKVAGDDAPSGNGMDGGKGNSSSHSLPLMFNNTSLPHALFSGSFLPNATSPSAMFGSASSVHRSELTAQIERECVMRYQAEKQLSEEQKFRHAKST